MSTDHKLTILFGLLSVGLLISLLIKLTTVPGGMILSGFSLGIVVLTGIIVGCLILASILRLIFKRVSVKTFFTALLTIGLLAFHWKLYSPTLTIIVPNGYEGDVKLILATDGENVLRVDTNGVGFLDWHTFHHSYTRPIVKEVDGTDLSQFLVGFNQSSFWGLQTSTSHEGKISRSKTFRIDRNKRTTDN
jgi:hypothetical protein